MANNRKSRKKKPQTVIGKNRKEYLESYGTMKGIYISTANIQSKLAEMIAPINQLMNDVIVPVELRTEIHEVLTHTLNEMERAHSELDFVGRKMSCINIPPNKAKELTVVDYYEKIHAVTNACMSLQESFLVNATTITLPDLLEKLEALKKENVKEVSNVE